MLQILLSLEYMHSKNVIHRDIKPSNVLWFRKQEKSVVKLCDFGLSKVKTDQDPSTPRVVTCWYRSPEICVKDPNYSYVSDVWSVGCLFYEMVSKKALLMGCKDNNREILETIYKKLPEIDDYGKRMAEKNNMVLGTNSTWKTMINLSDSEIEKFNEYPGDGATYDDFLDLLEKMMVMNPENRINASDALKHKFFKPYTNYIQWCHEIYPPVEKSEPEIKIINCIERKWATKLAFVVFDSRDKLPEWYKHRILFQSIDLFDRYLEHLQQTVETTNIETEYVGKWMTRYESQLRYVVCLYMSIKYFTTLSIPISFEELATEEYKTYEAMLKAEEFEKKMIRDVLSFKIYRETVYESADRLDRKLDEYQIRDLLVAYGICEDKDGVKPSGLLQEFNVFAEK